MTTTKHRRSPENLLRNLFQYDNDEKNWLEFRFKLENYLTLVDVRYVALLPERRVSTCGEPSDGNGRISSDHPNIESHTVRIAGDTDHGTKLETGAKSAEQKWVSKRGDRWRPRTRPNTAGRRFAMLQAVLQPGMSDNPAKFEETWEVVGNTRWDINENLSSTKAGR